MAGSVNKVILVGNLGKDPEIRTLNSGDRVANLRIATSESWRDKSSGERSVGCGRGPLPERGCHEGQADEIGEQEETRAA